MSAVADNPLFHLPTLAAIADTGSFSRAADMLGLNRAATSKRIVRMERALGVPVLSRTTRRVELTPAGQALLVRHREAEALLQLGVDEARGVMSKLAGRVELKCASSSLAVHIVAPALLDFTQKNPGIHVDLSTELPGIKLTTADIELRITDAPPGDRSARALAKVSWSMRASSAYLKRHGTPQAPKDLVQHRLFAPTNYDVPTTFTHRGSRQSVTVPPVFAMTSNIQEVIYELVRRGCGVGLLPNYLYSGAMLSTDLVEVLPEWRLQRLPAQTIYAIHPAGRYQRAATRAVIDHLARVCAQNR